MRASYYQILSFFRRSRSVGRRCRLGDATQTQRKRNANAKERKGLPARHSSLLDHRRWRFGHRRWRLRASLILHRAARRHCASGEPRIPVSHTLRRRSKQILFSRPLHRLAPSTTTSPSGRRRSIRTTSPRRTRRQRPGGGTLATAASSTWRSSGSRVEAEADA